MAQRATWRASKDEVVGIYVYMLRCADGSLYCGIARDVAARIAAHDAGTGARYTRGRGPLTVVLVRACADKPAALRLEHAIKQLPRPAKQAMIAEPAQLAALVRRVQRAARQRRRTLQLRQVERGLPDVGRPERADQP